MRAAQRNIIYEEHHYVCYITPLFYSRYAVFATRRYRFADFMPYDAAVDAIRLRYTSVTYAATFDATPGTLMPLR